MNEDTNDTIVYYTGIPNTLKITSDQAKQILWEESDEFKVIDQGEWTQDHKYQNINIIFQYNGDNYGLNLSRSGSPFTEWYYCFEDAISYECEPVVKKTKTIEYWESL